MFTLISRNTDLVQFRFERNLDVIQERVAVAVNIFDAHRSNDLTQLSEYDFFGLLADLTDRQPKKRTAAFCITSGLLADLTDRQPKKRTAAFCITSGLVSIATVKTLGTLTRMFSDDKTYLNPLGVPSFFEVTGAKRRT